MTTGQTVIMGLKTFESLGCKALPGRENFILDRSGNKPYPNQKIFSALDEALKQVRTAKAFIIGGAELYRTTVDLVDGIFLTRIHADFDGDVYYPEIPPTFVERSREKLQEDPLLEVVFYENVRAKGCSCCD